jgi:hypothetical protein
MSKKYITDVVNNNFVYPNNTQYELGQEVVQNINQNQQVGTVSSFTASASGSNISISFQFFINFNNAEQFKTVTGQTSVFSIHMMAAGEVAFKPWKLIKSFTALNPPQTGVTIGSEIITPAEMDLPYFVDGDYYFEVRFIGQNSIYPVTVTRTISGLPAPPTPTPTPSPTPTSTPTITPTPVPNIYTSGVTINVTDTGWLKYYTKAAPSTYTYYNATGLGSQVLPDCLEVPSITAGFPFADLAAWTVTSSGSSC